MRAKQVYSLSCLGKFDEAHLPVEKASCTLRIVLKVFFVNKYIMDYNYIEIPKINFPTLCSDYPEDSKIEVRMFTVADIKLISRVNEFNLKYIIDELMKRCCKFTNMTYTDLYIADRDYILMFLKSGSFITSNGFDIKLDKCVHCNEPITISLAIKDLELDVCTETRKTIDINGLEVKCQLPKVGQKLVKFKDVELEKIINYTNIAEIFGGVNEAISTILAWNAYDYVKLTNAVNEMKCGLKEELETVCPVCHEPITVHWHFSENDLLNKIPLEQLFENILSISKYANFQIDDSMAYGEVEVMCQVVNKMIEEDNKALNESEGQQTIYSGA